MTFKNQYRAVISLPAVTTHANAPQDLEGCWTKVHQICSLRNFFTVGVNATSRVATVHPLSNNGATFKKESNISNT